MTTPVDFYCSRLSFLSPVSAAMRRRDHSIACEDVLRLQMQRIDKFPTQGFLTKPN